MAKLDICLTKYEPSSQFKNLMLAQMASASSEGSGESAQLHRLTLAFVTVPKYHVLPEMAICVLFTPAA